jgi:alpha-tubulin suppressor-like RCC1 family protein
VDGCLRAVAIAIGDVFRCYLLSDGDVACSGDILPGTTVEDPVRVPGVHDAIGLAASARAACAVLRDGSVWCWGANLHGALGRGFVTTAETTRFDAEPVPGLSDVVGVGAGVAHHCAVHADGSVSCWGWNAAGQLGDDTTSSRASPAPAASYGDVDLVVGTTTTTCARVATGRVTCWGQGELLGDGSSVGRRTPGAPVRGVARVIAMDGGYRHVCAVADDGRAFCWGDNWTGGLGVETPSERPLWPVLAGGLTDAVAIAAGGSSTCAVRVGGGVRCWGDSSQRHDAVRVVDLGAVLPAMGPWIAYGEHRRGAIDRAGVPWVIAGPPFPALSPAP